VAAILAAEDAGLLGRFASEQTACIECSSGRHDPQVGWCGDTLAFRMLLAISDLTLALVVAGATLLGSAIGGAIAGVVTLRAENRRQGFIRRQGAERERRQLKQAGRLMAEELDDGRSKIILAHAEHHYWRTDDPIALTQWTTYRELLAAHLDDATWTTVATAFAWFRQLNRVVVDVAGTWGPLLREPPVEPHFETSNLETAWQCADDALSALRTALGVGAPNAIDEERERVELERIDHRRRAEEPDSEADERGDMA
jgi:hypothetical protein